MARLTNITATVKKLPSDFTLPTERGYYEEAPFDVHEGPTCEVLLGDGDGSLQTEVAIGDRVDVQEGAALRFTGYVQKRKRVRGANGHQLALKLRHRGYHQLRSEPCDPYTYDEDGDPITDRDAVKVNTWDWRIFRSPFGNTLDADGNPAPLDGLPHHQAFLALLGWRLEVMHRFLDNRFLRASDVVGTPGAQIQVLADSYDDEEVFSLQRVRGALGYAVNSTPIRLVPLESGDPNLSPMGNLDTVTLRFIGRQDSAASPPIVDVTRQGRAGSPTWEAITLTPTVNYLGSGLTLWEGTRTFTGPAGNSLGVRIRIGGTSTTETTRIYHMRASCGLLASDTGIGVGAADIYTDPHGGTLDKVWVDDDYEGLNRAEGLERLRTSTITNPAVSPGPHWDIYVDNQPLECFAYFQHRRGTDMATPVLDLAAGNITVLEHEEDGVQLAYQVIGVGGGTGTSQFTISDRVEFTSGGLYSAARDPTGVTRLHKDAPQRLVYRDQGCTSRSELRRRTRAFFAERLDPTPFYRVKVVPFDARTYATGDAIPLQDATLGINTTLRVNGIKVSWDARSGHDVQVSLGRRDRSPEEMLGNGRSRANIDKKAPLLAQGRSGVGGPGVNFTATKYGRATFSVPEGVEVDRVLLAMRTGPWQIYSRGGAVEDHDHPAADIDVGLGGTTSGAIGEPPFSVNLNANINFPTSPSGLVDFGGVFAPSPAASPAKIDRCTILLMAFNNSAAQHAGNITSAELVRVSTGEVVARSVQNVNSIDTTPQDASDTVPVTWKVLLRAVNSGEIVSGQTYKIRFNKVSTAGGNWTDDAGAIVDIDYLHGHDVDIAAGGAHEHPPKFGVWQFDGDGGNGDGAPKLAVGVRFGVDVGTDTSGIPNNFTAQRHPLAFGDENSPVSVLVDVTNYVRTGPDGRIASGEHEVFFLATAYTGNAQGLAVVQVTPILRAAGATG